jgi:hypothetical protein
VARFAPLVYKAPGLPISKVPGESCGGSPGPKGDAGARGATICDWKIDRARYLATPLMSDGGEGPPLELRGLFEQFFLEAR